LGTVDVKISGMYKSN